MSNPIIRYSGKHLEFRESEGSWEYVIRPNAKGCVGILAVTDDNMVVLTEQYRPPVDRNVIELPAGLAGDIPLQEDEPLETAARRELKEETGFEAKKWEKLIEGPTSPGLSDELITIFYAHELTRVSEGGGTRDEDIKVHIIKMADVTSWCEDQRAEGKLVNLKIFSALHMFQIRDGSSSGRLWY